MIWYRFAGFRLESLPRYLEDHPFLRVILRMSREHLRSKHRPETSGRVIVRKMPSCMALWHNPKAFDRICFWNPDQRRNTGMFLFLIAKYVEIQMNGRFFLHFYPYGQFQDEHHEAPRFRRFEFQSWWLKGAAGCWDGLHTLGLSKVPWCTRGIVLAAWKGGVPKTDSSPAWNGATCSV